MGLWLFFHRHFPIEIAFHAKTILTLGLALVILILALTIRRRGVAVNMLPCQGRDRGFESRRFRSGTNELSSQSTAVSVDFLFPKPSVMW